MLGHGCYGRGHVCHCHVQANFLGLLSHEVAIGLRAQVKVEAVKWLSIYDLLIGIHTTPATPQKDDTNAYAPG